MPDSRELRAARQKLIDEQNALLDAAETRDASGNLTPEEQAEYDANEVRIAEFGPRIEREELREQRVRDAAAAAPSAGVPAEEPARIRVGNEPHTYSRTGQHSYFRDLVRSNPVFGLGGAEQARERRMRHSREIEVDVEQRVREGRTEFESILADIQDEREKRDLTRTDTTSVGEFVPPLWLVDEYGKFLRAARPTADLCTKLALPGGTDSINIPRLTTGTAVAAQTADNQAVQKTDAVSATVTAPVRTIAGQQDMAIQILDQSPVAFDQVIFMDLAADYAAKLDIQVLNGTGANGQVLGINPLVAGSATSIAYTDGSPTLPELYPFLSQCVSKVSGTRFLPPTAIVMHPRRWFWMTSILDSTNRPLVVPTVAGPFNATGVEQEVNAQGPVGQLVGLPVVLDPNIPVLLTNGAGAAGTEDVIIIARFSDALLFEGTPRMRTLPEVLSNTLEVRLQLYNYVAFTAGRYPPGFGRVFDTGMAAPSGF